MTSETKLPPLPMITRPPGKVATAYSLADLHAYATAYARAAVEQAKPEGDAGCNPLPNWCRTCGRHATDPMAVLCSDGIHHYATHKENAP